MKEKDVRKVEELESISDELFDEFDPENESSIGGGPYTITSSLTLSGSSFDHQADIDWTWEELNLQTK